MSGEIISVLNHQIEVRRRPRQRTMNLSVKADGLIRVSCNRGMPVRDIAAFVASCGDFIARRRGQIQEMEGRFPLKNFVSGEEFLYLGERVKLEVIWSWHRRARVERLMEMLAPVSSTKGDRHKALIGFYRREAKRWLRARVDFWGRVMNLPSSSLTIRGQRTLWGSCTVDGKISLNWKLMCAPADVIDYVVIHELAHIRERNHSPRFWALVAQFMPEYQLHRQWLRVHQQEISRMFLVYGKNQPA